MYAIFRMDISNDEHYMKALHILQYKFKSAKFLFYLTNAAFTCLFLSYKHPMKSTDSVSAQPIRPLDNRIHFLFI